MTIPRRWRVVMPGFLAGALLSVLFGVDKLGWSASADDVLIYLAPVAGPFAEPLAYTEYDIVRMAGFGAVMGVLIGLHAIRPNIWTGLVSGSSIPVWFLWGVCNTYNAV